MRDERRHALSLLIDEKVLIIDDAATSLHLRQRPLRAPTEHDDASLSSPAVFAAFRQTLDGIVNIEQPRASHMKPANSVLACALLIMAFVLSPRSASCQRRASIDTAGAIRIARATFQEAERAVFAHRWVRTDTTVKCDDDVAGDTSRLVRGPGYSSKPEAGVPDPAEWLRKFCY